MKCMKRHSSVRVKSAILKWFVLPVREELLLMLSFMGSPVFTVK